MPPVRAALRVVSDADPRGSSGSPQMKPRKKAPLAEAVPYTPKIVLFGNGVGMFLGARECPERSICVDLRRSAPICVAPDMEPSRLSGQPERIDRFPSRFGTDEPGNVT